MTAKSYIRESNRESENIMPLCPHVLPDVDITLDFYIVQAIPFYVMYPSTITVNCSINGLTFTSLISSKHSYKLSSESLRNG